MAAFDSLSCPERFLHTMIVRGEEGFLLPSSRVPGGWVGWIDTCITDINVSSHYLHSESLKFIFNIFSAIFLYELSLFSYQSFINLKGCVTISAIFWGFCSFFKLLFLPRRITFDKSNCGTSNFDLCILCMVYPEFHWDCLWNFFIYLCFWLLWCGLGSQ